MKLILRDILIPIVSAVVIFFILQATIPSFVVISGSMEPTLPVGERLLINKVVYHFGEPRRGDIIIFYPNGDREATPFIKRVIGLPTESVEIKDGIVYIHKKDGSILQLDELAYIKDPPDHPFAGDIIPENEYFVLGDNRNNSSDSRVGWTVKREDIIGKAWLSIWPPSAWGLAPNYALP